MTDEAEHAIRHTEDRDGNSYYDVDIRGVTFKRVKVNKDGSISVLIRDRRNHGDELANAAIAALKDHIND